MGVYEMSRDWKDLFPEENRYYETNNGILYKGKAIEMMSKFPKDIFDAIITDPPYGTTACKWDVVIPFEDMWRELKKIRKDRTPIVLFGSEPFSSLLRVSNLKEFKYDWIWVKDKPNNFALANKQPMKYHEVISVFYKKQCIYNKQLERRTGSGSKRCNYIVDNSKRYSEHLTLKDKPKFYDKDWKNPSSVQFFSTGRRQDLVHPTQKPLELLEYLIKTYTNEGDLVLDFTCGSGTTLVACEKLNRRWIGIEINPEYCEITKKRIEEIIKQRGLF